MRRLRIYPHALRDRNAYYSPSKKALLFGYFPVASKDEDNTPGTIVFTCLSHDIIAHETTHALLDGVHPRFNEPTNPDVQAFHEAFADIVALFQHFTYPAVLESQIRRTRGDLAQREPARAAGAAVRAGHRTGAALRDALGRPRRETGTWKPRPPDPHALESTLGAHDRGAILVAAVFRAFLLIYRARTADLFRIATQGTGTLPEGEIHPDLTARLAQEAARCADRVLQMCIRAIDYCPPVDITFGDFLRGIITADLDFSPEDREQPHRLHRELPRVGDLPARHLEHGRRRARLADGRGADEGARWPTGRSMHSPERAAARTRRVRATSVGPVESRERPLRGVEGPRPTSREPLDDWLREGDSLGRDYARIFGLEIDPTRRRRPCRGRRTRPAVEVHAVRPAIRRTACGMTSTDLVIEITQRRDGYFDKDEQKRMDDMPAQRPRRRARHPISTTAPARRSSSTPPRARSGA